MKKIILFAAAAVAISFASCGNKSAQQEEVTEEATEVIETVVEEVEATTDSTVATVDSLVNEVK